MLLKGPVFSGNMIMFALCVAQRSKYGGTAWSWDHIREQYYYHYYNEHMPDYNYRNEQVTFELKVAIIYSN